MSVSLAEFQVPGPWPRLGLARRSPEKKERNPLSYSALGALPRPCVTWDLGSGCETSRLSRRPSGRPGSLSLSSLSLFSLSLLSLSLSLSLSLRERERGSRLRAHCTFAAEPQLAAGAGAAASRPPSPSAECSRQGRGMPHMSGSGVAWSI